MNRVKSRKSNHFLESESSQRKSKWVNVESTQNTDHAPWVRVESGSFKNESESSQSEKSESSTTLALWHGCFPGIKRIIDTDDQMQVNSLDLVTAMNRNNMRNIKLLCISSNLGGHNPHPAGGGGGQNLHPPVFSWWRKKYDRQWSETHSTLLDINFTSSVIGLENRPELFFKENRALVTSCHGNFVLITPNIQRVIELWVFKQIAHRKRQKT